ncbi:hypothetical protein R4R86_004753 [Citrobacter farmeri]|nr:hypothetical protein [Citrobacter farmeri]
MKIFSTQNSATQSVTHIFSALKLLLFIFIVSHIAFVRQQELKKHNEKQSAGAPIAARGPLIEPVDLLLAGTVTIVSIVLLLFAC